MRRTFIVPTLREHDSLAVLTRSTTVTSPIFD